MAEGVPSLRILGGHVWALRLDRSGQCKGLFHFCATMRAWFIRGLCENGDAQQYSAVTLPTVEGLGLLNWSP